MFFIGIFGIQNKDRLLKEYDSVICPDCGRLSRAELFETYTYFHFFFIPLFKWGRKYFVKLRCCNGIFVAEEDYAKQLLNSETIDFDRLQKFGIYDDRACSNCGAYVNPNFNYCPNCGNKLY